MDEYYDYHLVVPGGFLKRTPVGLGWSQRSRAADHAGELPIAVRRRLVVARPKKTEPG